MIYNCAFVCRKKQSHIFTKFWTVFKYTLIMSLNKTYISFCFCFWFFCLFVCLFVFLGGGNKLTCTLIYTQQTQKSPHTCFSTKCRRRYFVSDVYIFQCMSAVACRESGLGGFKPPPPNEIPKFWESRTGLQIERKMFSVPIPTS